mmetsp:Transcript_59868/g.118886  ORF Transcript_59868/g.118886 Transcript_59868/m.118886 type:complete len:92 (-) Transcript_59868:426-701(-)
MMGQAALIPSVAAKMPPLDVLATQQASGIANAERMLVNLPAAALARAPVRLCVLDTPSLAQGGHGGRYGLYRSWSIHVIGLREAVGNRCRR